MDISEDEAVQQLYGHLMTYRIALGPHQASKVFTLQSLPSTAEPKSASSRVANVAGFSLHAGIMTEAHQRDKLQRLCRYIARPAVVEKILAHLEKKATSAEPSPLPPSRAPPQASSFH